MTPRNGSLINLNRVALPLRQQTLDRVIVELVPGRFLAVRGRQPTSLRGRLTTLRNP